MARGGNLRTDTVDMGRVRAVRSTHKGKGEDGGTRAWDRGRTPGERRDPGRE